MNFDEFQEICIKHAGNQWVSPEKFVHMILGIITEAGTIAEFNQKFTPVYEPSGLLADMLGNILQNVALIARFYQIPLDDIVRHQALKLETLSR